MSSINKILGGLFPHREPKEDEYINEADGLIYCAIVNVFNILTLDDYLSKMHCIVGSGK